MAAGLIRLLFRLLCRVTDRVVLAKRSVAGDFPADPAPLLVQNFTPVASLQQGLQDESACGKDDGTLTAIHLGLISVNRGWPQLVDSVRLAGIEQLRVHVIGHFHDQSADSFHQAVQAADLSDTFDVDDWMPFEEAFRCLTNADIGLVLFQPGIQNHVYALPHKLFDYMLAGLPVIVPDFAEEVSGIVREAECGLLVDPSNPREIAEALRLLASDADLRRRLGQNGRRAVLEKYNWEAEAQKLIPMYRDQSTRLSRAA
jgi:glycosyltransferase involved in cell wall biosynthesis